MPRRVPQQQRSRDRIDAIIAAAQDMLRDSTAADLTIGRLAEHSGVSAPSIYRYFADKDAVVAAVLDHEMELLDLAIAQAFAQLEVVNLRAMFEVALRAHLEHHRARPWMVSIWFGEPRSATVRERILAMDRRTGEWLQAATGAAGMFAPGVATEHILFLIRLCDRTLEYVLTSGLDEPEQDRVVGIFVDMISTYLGQWTTPNGRDGVSLEAFVQALGEPPRHLQIDQP